MHTVNFGKTKFTPPQIAMMWGVSTMKVVAFIKSGELRAVNFASPGKNQRPRYLVDIEDLKEFEKRRTVCPAPKIPPRRKTQELDTGDYY